MRKVFHDYAKRIAGAPRETVKQIALLWSQDTWAFYEPGDDSRSYRYEFLGFARALLEDHHIFDVIIDSEIRCPADLEPYELLILPNVACLSENLAKIIDAYVQQGGKLLATGESSLLNERGRARDDLALRKVLGVSYQSRFNEPTCYLPDGDEPCPCPSEATVVHATEAQIRHHLIAPDPDYPNEGTGVDLVPGPSTQHPLLTMHRHGQGKAWYLTATLGKANYTYGYWQMQEWIAGLFAEFQLAELYRLDAPKSVEIHMEQDDAGTIYVHLVNLTTPHPVPAREIVRSINEIVTLHGIQLFIPGRSTARGVHCDGADIAAQVASEGLKLSVDALGDSCTIAIPPEGSTKA